MLKDQLNETFTTLVQRVHETGKHEALLDSKTEATRVRGAFYRWRNRHIADDVDLIRKANDVMVKVEGGKLTFYVKGAQLVESVEKVLMAS